MTDTASDDGTDRPGSRTEHSGSSAARPGESADEWTRAVDRFAAWLTDFSPLYRELRVPVQVPDDAPARLAYFWRTVGWAPGIGLGWYGRNIPPVRELGRIEADRAFQRWLGPECFAPTMALTEPTVQALWDRLPQRCWVLRASVETHHSRGARCHGGALFYVDEDAGDDPPLMEWITSKAGHDTGPVSPRVEAQSSVAYLMGSTLATIAGSCGIRRPLPTPARPGLFAPVFPYFWRLGEGVWGMPDPMYTGVAKILAAPEAPTTLGVTVYRSARAYLEFLAGVPAEQLPGWGNRISGAHAIDVVDAKALSTRRLAERNFTYAERENGSTAAGRLDGIPVLVSQYAHGGVSGTTTFLVAQEDHPAFCDLLSREQIEVSGDSWEEPARWWAEPSEAARAQVAQLVEQAERAAGRVTGRQAPGRDRRVTRTHTHSTTVEAADAPDTTAETADTPDTTAETADAPDTTAETADTPDTTADTAVRAEAAALREWVLAASPGLELTTPDLAADEPVLVRALWEELGYSSEFEEMLGWPDRASSERALEEMLAEYRSRGGYELERTSLPKRLRLVWIDGDNDSNLLVTDEDSPVDDPPILGVDAEDGQVDAIEEFPSYITYVGEQIAWYAGEGQANWSVRTTPPLAELGTQPYPRLAPKIRQLAPGICASPEGGSATISARRFRDLIAWIAQTTMVDRLELCPHYGPRDPAARIRLGTFTPPPGLREWQAPSGQARCYAGLVDDVPVLVQVADRIMLYTPHADRERARSVAAAAGWI